MLQRVAEDTGYGNAFKKGFILLMKFNVLNQVNVGV